MSSIVLLRCSNRRPINGLVRFIMTTIFSRRLLSPTLNCNSTVAIGSSNCLLATKIWTSGAGLSFNTACGTIIRILRNLASGMALDKAPVSMRPSIFSSLTSSGKNSLLRIFFIGSFVESRRKLVFSSCITWNCGKTWSSLTANCLCWLCDVGWKFGNGDVSDKCGFTVQKSFIAHRSASDTCASIIKSSLPIWSLDLLWLSLYSNLSWSY